MRALPDSVPFDRTTPPCIATLVLLSSIAALAMTLILPSLPGITAHFEADYAVVQLSVSAYLFVNGALHIVVGPLSDRFGRRPVTIWAIALFLLATLGCMAAPTVEIFLAFRMMQAVVVVGIVISRAAVRDMVPQDRAASMIGYVTMGMAMVPMLAPMIGGALDEAFGWQAAFGFLALFGAAVLAVVLLDQGETATRGTSFRRQVREYPELFASRRFWGYAAASSFASGTFFAYLGGTPIIGAVFYALSPSEIGFFFGMTAFGYMLGNFVTARLSSRHGINRMVLLGTAILALGPFGALLSQLHGGGHPLEFFAWMILMGIGNGIIIPNATAGTLSVRPRLAGTASGVGGAIAIGGGSGISALSGALLAGDGNPIPMLTIMLCCTALCLAAILYVIRVARKARAHGQG